MYSHSEHTSMNNEHLVVPVVTLEKFHRGHFAKPALITIAHLRCFTVEKLTTL